MKKSNIIQKNGTHRNQAGFPNSRTMFSENAVIITV